MRLQHDRRSRHRTDDLPAVSQTVGGNEVIIIDRCNTYILTYDIYERRIERRGSLFRIGRVDDIIITRHKSYTHVGKLIRHGKNIFELGDIEGNYAYGVRIQALDVVDSLRVTENINYPRILFKIVSRNNGREIGIDATVLEHLSRSLRDPAGSTVIGVDDAEVTEIIHHTEIDDPAEDQILALDLLILA